MILIQSTAKGYVLGLIPDNPKRAWAAPKTVRTHEHLPPMERRRYLAKVARWLRLGKRYAN